MGLLQRGGTLYKDHYPIYVCNDRLCTPTFTAFPVIEDGSRI